MNGLRHAPATARNREPIAAVLERVLPKTGTVLEIASGTGEHAVYFAGRFPGISWQPSDADGAARETIAAWTAHEERANVLAPIALDAREPVWPIDAADAIVCINMVHISPWSSCEGLMSGSARLLRVSRGPLFVYGPFRVGGSHTALSNARFDEDLRARDPSWGVRDLEAVVAEASRHGFALRESIAMPANNLSLVFDPAG